MITMPSWLRGTVMLAATALSWGGMFPVMKPLLMEIDPITLTLIRFGFATPILIILLVFLEGSKSLAFQGKFFSLWWLGTLGFAGFGLLLVLGLDHAQPEHAAVVPALMPLITVVIAAIRDRSLPTAKAIIAIALGILGVVLVVTRGDPSALWQGTAGKGELLVLLGATCWVFYTLGAAKFPGWSGLRYTTITLALGTLTIIAIEVVVLTAGIIRFPEHHFLVNAIPAFIYLVVAASVMGFLFWNAGTKALGPTKGVLFINLVPVTAFTIGLIQGNVPNIWEIVGVVLVITALVFNSLPNRQCLRSLADSV